MSTETGLLNPKLWAVIDFIVAGWDLRAALTHAQEGEMFWALIMLVLALILIGVGVMALRASDRRRRR